VFGNLRSELRYLYCLAVQLSRHYFYLSGLTFTPGLVILRQMVAFIAASPPSALGYLMFIVETVVALALIGLAAWAVRRWSGGRLPFGRQGGRMRSIERLSLDARRSIHLVEVDGQTLLIGAGEHSVTLLKELPRKVTGVDEDGTEKS
jgi:flagellar biosynthetic protein FliO